MAVYQIEVQELLAKVINIEASSSEGAIKKVKLLHEQAKIVLDWSDFAEVNFIDINGGEPYEDGN